MRNLEIVVSAIDLTQSVEAYLSNKRRLKSLEHRRKSSIRPKSSCSPIFEHSLRPQSAFLGEGLVKINDFLEDDREQIKCADECEVEEVAVAQTIIVCDEVS